MQTIILGQIGENKTTAFAVSELKRILSVMDASLDIAIIKSDYIPNMKNVIWAGLDESLGIEANETVDTVKIELKGFGGVITGSNHRSVLIAAYRFLRELGCRFVKPGKKGEIIPQKAINDLSVSLTETASYPHRGVCIEGADSYDNILDMIDFLPKVGMNEYFVQFMVPTEFFHRWYEHRGSNVLHGMGTDSEGFRLLAEGMTASLENEIQKRSLVYHKAGHGWTCEPFGINGGGWFSCETPLTEAQKNAVAEVNGKRELWGGIPLNTNLCYSNESVRETITDAITDYAIKNPHIDVIHFWLADGSNNHCECESCKKKRPADWYMQTLNELDAKMTAKGIKTKIVFLIYVDLLWEPEAERLYNPDRFILMFAPITRNYGQNYGDFLTYDKELPPYVRNKLEMPASLAQNIEHLRRWQAIFKGDSFDFDYHLMWAHVGDIGYEKCAYNLFCDMKDLRKIGLSGMVSCQIQRCFYPTALPFLSMAAALWDENSDFDTLAKDYYNAAFGEKANGIRNAMKALSDSCSLYENTSPVWNEEKALKALEMLKAAVTKDKKLCELALYTEYLELVFNLFRALEAEDKEKTKAASEKLYDWLWKNEEKLQGILDVLNTVHVFSRLIK